MTPTPGGPAPVVRAPAVGQSWRYAKHDYFTGDWSIPRSIVCLKSANRSRLQSRSETAEDKPIAFPSWGESWWQELYARRPVARVPIEIQKPWGMVVVDPHWSEMQAFKKAIPLWPSELRPGWS